MTIIGGTLSRYFGLRFLSATLAVFIGLLLLTALLDYVEMTRAASSLPEVSAASVVKVSLYRVPQIVERLMPFCVLIGALSSYLNLSRRNELVVARAAGVSAWQFIAPAIVVALLLGIFATAVYNPVSALLQERSKRIENEMFGAAPMSIGTNTGTFWIRQRSSEGEAIINSGASREQGVELGAVSIFKFSTQGAFLERIEAKSAVLQAGHWRLTDVRSYPLNGQPRDLATAELPTNLTREQVRETFATPESVPFWELPQYISTAEHVGLIATGYRLQYQKLLAKPFLLGAMVLLAAAVSLRFFRFGGVQKMILGGISAGFLLYVLSKVTDDMTKVGLMHPVAAAWLPVFVAGITGIVVLLYQEDG